MIHPASPIDSALLPSELVAPPDRLATRIFPPHDERRLRDFAEYLSESSEGNPANCLSSLSEPGLYALVVALTMGSGAEAGSRALTDFAAAVPALLSELRRRDCRGMGADPIGPVRRGRLLQLVGTFMTLTPAGGSPLRQEDKLMGDCPFCGAGASFQVYLPGVRWQCFGCARSGALLEFAEYLLEPLTPADSPAA